MMKKARSVPCEFFGTLRIDHNMLFLRLESWIVLDEDAKKSHKNDSMSRKRVWSSHLLSRIKQGEKAWKRQRDSERRGSCGDPSLVIVEEE